ncbi:MAG: efflux RND transporter periplasmic adaptor subunit, partial [Armatimonadetes bacterium]|nr:efflux RND transporter periplasmic adaptor subunit [Armatimonadota bacterium]
SQSRALAGIADTEAESRVAGARAVLQSARERLKSLQDGARRQEKLAAEAGVTRAGSQVERTRAALERREQLLRDGAIAREAVDNARRDHEAALADLEAARQQASLVREGPRGEEIRVAEEAIRQAEAALRDAEANRARRQVSQEEVEAAATQVRQAEAARDASQAGLAQTRVTEEEIRGAQAAVVQARADLRYQDELIAQTRIYSPIRGLVTKQVAHVGESIVQMRNELLHLVALDPLFVEATAPEGVLPFLRPGLPVRLLLDARPGREIAARLTEIIPVAEGANRSVRLRVSLPGAVRERVVVGGFARMEVGGASGAAVLSVPRSALVSDDAELGVFVEESGKARRRPVRLGDLGGVGERVPVLTGLTAGERVIVSGAGELVDGAPVTVRAGEQP